MTTLSFTNFTKGEIGPELQARIDTDQYKAGAKKVSNFIIQRYGGLSFRPGFRLVGEVDDIVNDLRYVTFQFNIEQAYVLALKNYDMRLLANGGFVLEDCFGITAITQDVHALITAPYHGLSVGDKVYFSEISGMTQINGRFGTVLTVPSANTFTVDINTSQFSAFTGSTCTVRTGPPPPPPTPPSPPAPAPGSPPPPATGGSGGSGSDTGGGSGLHGGGSGSGYQSEQRQ